MSIHERIQAILQARQAQLPQINTKLKQARLLGETLVQLNSALQDLMTYPTAPEALRLDIQAVLSHPLQTEIAALIKDLLTAQTRLSRQTLNIGVSGQARVGKSTLLQTLSGLTDEQIPTGAGIPVTAVRSRLRHSPRTQQATLMLHSFESFRDQVLRPYHRELLLPYPDSLSDFKSFNYEATTIDVDALSMTQRGLLLRLKAMQRSLPSYEQDLTGQSRLVGLEGLREWVAYPSQAQASDPDCPRRYLAVRDVLIECPFPETEVENLTIIDLPGLGELDAAAERHHVEGLQNEVDLVLLIKRPVQGMAYWTQADAKATDLLDEARGAVEHRKDFTLIVVNEGGPGSTPELVAALLSQIQQIPNEGEPERHYKVLRCDATDLTSVRQHLLLPCLEHLAEQLPSMDQQVIKVALTHWQTTTQQLLQLLQNLHQRLQQSGSLESGSQETLDKLTEQLRRNLSTALNQLQRERYQRIQPQDQGLHPVEDADLIEMIQATSEQIREWIEGQGLGVGRESWIQSAYARILEDNNISPLASDELNRIRVQISETFCQLDQLLDAKVQTLWSQVSQAIGCHTGDLLEGISDGKAALEQLSLDLELASEPCPTLQKAIQELLQLKISYRSHFHPRVREKLDLLNYELVDKQGQLKPQFTASLSLEGAAHLYRQIADLATAATHDTQQALLSESIFSDRVLHAAIEQFVDSLIRSEASKWEFKRLGRSYRDAIWPGVFEKLDAQHAKVVQVRRYSQAIERLIEESTGFKGQI